MLYCFNPTCSNPFNHDGNKFCLNCGLQTLTPLFRNRYRVIRLLGEGGFGKTYEAIDTDRMDDPCVIKQFFPQIQATAALEKATELFNLTLRLVDCNLYRVNLDIYFQMLRPADLAEGVSEALFEERASALNPWRMMQLVQELSFPTWKARAIALSEFITYLPSNLPHPITELNFHQ